MSEFRYCRAPVFAGKNDRPFFFSAMWLILVTLTSCAMLAITNAAAAMTGQSGAQNTCDAAAHIAASQSNVPISILLSITRTETGRAKNGKLQPWPWTVNMEGKGVWFDTEDEARSYVYRHFKRGARSFDVGCFQINYKWHGEAFSSIDEMFDPVANAHYAARFLSSLFDEFGDWTKAAGAYHSRTPEFADKYISRFEGIRAALTVQDNDPERGTSELVARSNSPQPREIPRENRFPLLKPGGTVALGSLVPISTGTGRSLFSKPTQSGG